MQDRGRYVSLQTQTPKSEFRDVLMGDDTTAGTLESLLNGSETRIISHSGSSQYEAGGQSSCGLACLNFSRLVFRMFSDKIDGKAMLKSMASRQFIEETMTVCSLWKSTAHMDVEDIFHAAIFEHSMARIPDVLFDTPSLKTLKKTLQMLEVYSSQNDCPVVAVITRPPEIIACLYLAIGDARLFIIFDSHPRSEYPAGAALVINSSIEATASYLNKLLAVDMSLLDDDSLQWQAQLLAHFSAHFFIPLRERRIESESESHIILETSIQNLLMKAEMAELKFINSRLTTQNDELEVSVIDLRDQVKKLKSSLKHKMRSQTDDKLASDAEKSSSSKFSIAPSSSQLNSRKSQQPSESSSNGRFKGKGKASSPTDLERLITAHVSHDFNFTDADQESLRLAMEMQAAFNQENEDLVMQKSRLADSAKFNCNLCLEELPEDDVARVDECSHACCRGCMRQYVLSKIKEHSYPIFCPICIADKNRTEQSAIGTELVEQIGMSEEDYAVYQEMQLATLSTMVHCRKCRQTAYVALDEYTESDVILCPIPNCTYAWCKHCNQAIPLGGPKHSCDGSSELEHLMKQKGWKHCPGCKTPIQKTHGCHHMTCMSPGCNTHFCYVCGDQIIRSALPREVKHAVSSHYRKCRLFDDVAER